MNETSEAIDAFGAPPRQRFWRLLRTPLVDLLRGRLTGRSRLVQWVAAMELPDELKRLVYLLARRTRLWRREQRDVAREMHDHFRDGLAAGRTAAELTETFGDVKVAARLIRRAKIRSRGAFHRAFRRGLQSAGVLILVAIVAFVFLLVRFQFARPTIARNYVQELDEQKAQVPQDEWAWPIYRAALSNIGREPLREFKQNIAHYRHDEDLPKSWAAVVRFLEDHRATLDQLRQAAHRPHMGFIYTDPANDGYLRETWPAKSLDEITQSALIYLSLEHLGDTGRLSLVMQADLHQAAGAGDGPRVVADLNTMLAMAEQTYGDSPFVVTGLVSFARLREMCRATSYYLYTQPDLFDDAALTALAHRLGSFAGGGHIRVPLAGERLMWDDLLQRLYTDDGSGDGILAREGIGGLVDEDWTSPVNSLSGGLEPFESILAAAVAGRREMHDKVHGLINRAAADAQRPLWLRETPDEIDIEIDRLQSSSFSSLRFMPLMVFMTRLSSVARAGDMITQQRDALLVAIALELHRRRRGTWPVDLDQLAPQFLPAVPIDQLDGQPLRYKLVDGAPLLYSVSHDGVDNGGRATEDQWRFEFTSPAKGCDWILYPHPSPWWPRGSY